MTISPIVPLWGGTASNNQFVYYVTGGIGLVYLVALFIAYCTRRTRSSVIVLPAAEKFDKENVLFKYLLVIDSSFKSGRSLSRRTKLYLQLIGQRAVSRFHQLRVFHSGRFLMQAGNKDIIVFKLKEHLGFVQSVKLVLVGEKKCKWEPIKTKVIRLATGERWTVPIEVHSINTINSESKDIIFHPNVKQSCCITLCQDLPLYHVWLSPLIVSMRFGVVTDFMNLLFVFFSTCLLMVSTLIIYIIIPQDLSDIFYLQLDQFIYTAYATLVSAAFLGFLRLILYLSSSGNRKKVQNYQQYCLKCEGDSKNTKSKISLLDLQTESMDSRGTSVDQVKKRKRKLGSVHKESSSNEHQSVKPEKGVDSDSKMDSFDDLAGKIMKTELDDVTSFSGEKENCISEKSSQVVKVDSSCKATYNVESENSVCKTGEKISVMMDSHSKCKIETESSYCVTDAKHSTGKRRSKNSFFSIKTEDSSERHLELPTLSIISSKSCGNEENEQKSVGNSICSFYSLNLFEDSSDQNFELPPPCLKSLNTYIDIDEEKEEKKADKTAEIERRNQEVDMFSRTIVDKVYKMVLDIKTDVVEGRFGDALETLEQGVMQCYTDVEEQLRQQVAFLQYLKKGINGDDDNLVEVVVDDGFQALSFFYAASYVINTVLHGILNSLLPGCLEWIYETRLSEIAQQTVDLICEFDGQRSLPEFKTPRESFSKADEEVVLDDHVSLDFDESQEDSIVHHTMSILLQKVVMLAFFEVFGEEKVFSLNYFMDSLLARTTKSLLRKVFVQKTGEIKAISDFCSKIIEEAKLELAVDFHDPVKIYIQFLSRQKILEVLDHLGKSGHVKEKRHEELIENLKKKWRKEGFHTSYPANKYLAQVLVAQHMDILEKGRLLEINPLYSILMNMATLQRLEKALSKALSRKSVENIKSQMRWQRDVHSGTTFIPLDRGDFDAMEYVDAVTDVCMGNLQQDVNKLVQSIVNDEVVMVGAAHLSQDALDQALHDLHLEAQVAEYDKFDVESLNEEEAGDLSAGLKSLNAYLHLKLEIESLTEKLDNKKYREKNEKKHKNFAVVNYQNVLDSYNILDEDSLDNSLTNNMLYQLEWEITKENRKPLPHFLKGIVGFILCGGTVMCLEYAGQTGGQLNLTQVKEWAACYMISLLMFGLVVEWLWALVIGLTQLNYR